MHHVCKGLLMVGQVCLMSACTFGLDFDYNPEVEQELIDRAVPIQPVVDVGMLTLNGDLQALIDTRIKSGWGANYKIQELRELLFNEDELNIRYDTGFTKTAQQTFDSRSGNCLSLTSLFIAAARHTGLDAHFEVVSVHPSWDYQSKTMIRYENVIATGRLDA